MQHFYIASYYTKHCHILQDTLGLIKTSSGQTEVSLRCMSVLMAIAAIDNNPLNCLTVSTTHRPMEFSISPLAHLMEFSAALMVILALIFSTQYNINVGGCNVYGCPCGEGIVIL